MLRNNNEKEYLNDVSNEESEESNNVICELVGLPNVESNSIFVEEENED